MYACECVSNVCMCYTASVCVCVCMCVCVCVCVCVSMHTISDTIIVCVYMFASNQYMRSTVCMIDMH